MSTISAFFAGAYDGDFGLTVGGQRSEERPAEIVVDKALEYLNQSTSPWFLWIHCYDPHDPYEPPEPFKTEYSGHLYDGEVAYVDSVLKKLFQYLENKDFDETRDISLKTNLNIYRKPLSSIPKSAPLTMALVLSTCLRKNMTRLFII